MTLQSSLARKTLLAVAVLLFLSCPLIFLAGVIAPRTLGFLDGVMCPQDMHLNNRVSSQSDLRGNITAVEMLCTGEETPPVDATPKMLLLLFTIPVLGMIVMGVRSRLAGQQSQTMPPETAT